MRTILSAVLLSSVGLVAACSGQDGAPLGGPYGGTGSSPPPSADQATDGTDPSSSGGSSTSSSGGSSTSSSGGSSTSSSGHSSTSSSSGGSTSSSSSGGSTSSSSSSSSSSGGGAPTWTQIYTSYLKSGTIGRCSDCHSQTSSASKTYSWLSGRGQIPGVADSSQSCLSWLGGNMPPSGPSSNSKAASDLAAWAAAGAANN